MTGVHRLPGRFRRAGASAAVLLLVAGLLSLPEAATAGARQDGHTVLRAAITRGIDSLNPFLAGELAATELGRLNYEYLTTYAARDFARSPGLAESWTTSDPRTWMFTIRDGMRWSDGEPISAKDVEFTFNLMMTDETAGSANGSYVSGFESVRALDARRVEIRTKEPRATMLALNVPIVPAHVWSKVGDLGAFTNGAAPVVGSGPFVLTEYRPQQFATFTANDRFWGGRPQVDELRFVAFQNTDAAVQALRKGEVDLIGGGVNGALTPAQFDALKNAPGVTVNKARGPRVYQLVMNPGAAAGDGTPLGDGHPALRDVRVRRAIALGVDTRQLVDRILGGYGAPGAGLVPPVFADMHFAPDKTPAFDPAAANRMLDEAGYARGGDGVRYTADGRPLRFRLSGRQDRDADVRAAAFVKEWLRDLGIEVELRLVSGSEHGELSGSGQYDLTFSGWGVAPDPNYLLSVQTCAARPANADADGTTDAFFCDQEYDRLYAAQLAELDAGKRAGLIRQAQARLYDQVPSLVLYYPDSLEAYRSDRFHPFLTQPDPGGVIAGQSGYWGYASAEPVPPGGPSGPRPLTFVGIGVGALVLAAGVWLLVGYRRRGADYRE